MGDGIEALIRALDSSNHPTFLQAQSELLASGDAAVEPLLNAIKKRTIVSIWEAANVLVQIKEFGCIEMMRDWLVSDDLLLADTAADLLIKHDKSCADLFIQVLPESHILIQIHIVKALKDMGERRAAETLEEMLRQTNSSTLRYTLIEALGVLGDHHTISLIQQFQNDENDHVRKRTQIALRTLEQTQYSNRSNKQ